MQSPININTPKSNEALTGNNFYLDYKFEKEVPFVVTRHGPEVVVKFQGYGGALKVIYKEDGTMVSYQPKYISFRFPAEHTINKFRLDGEIIVVFDEIAPKNNEVI